MYGFVGNNGLVATAADGAATAGRGAATGALAVGTAALLLAPQPILFFDFIKKLSDKLELEEIRSVYNPHSSVGSVRS